MSIDAVVDEFLSRLNNILSRWALRDEATALAVRTGEYTSFFELEAVTLPDSLTEPALNGDEQRVREIVREFELRAWLSAALLGVPVKEFDEFADRVIEEGRKMQSEEIEAVTPTAKKTSGRARL